MKAVVGQVFKGIAGRFFVNTDEGIVICDARGKLKQDGKIFIGDFVEIVVGAKKGSIEKVLPRTTQLVRPFVSNVEVMLIVIAPLPKPDLLLVDKLLIYCIKDGVRPIVCINKVDIAEREFLAQMQSEYADVADIVETSATNKQGIDRLRELIDGSFVCFAGQSAVGKSSIINALEESFNLKVGELSKKLRRGRNTTRQVEIFKLNETTLIADTCGFSSLELPKFSEKELSEFYLDFNEFSDNCKFRGCNHIEEPDCAVLKAVAEGEISESRYQRYKILFLETKSNWRNRYE